MKSETSVMNNHISKKPIMWSISGADCSGGAGIAADREPGTDFFALSENCVSITPLHVDMTDYSGMDNVAEWLEKTL